MSDGKKCISGIRGVYGFPARKNFQSKEITLTSDTWQLFFRENRLLSCEFPLNLASIGWREKGRGSG